ncbi:MAG: bifunctional 2-polyprenyl-6-hydroxyphenol methylase/3-demethylubiquinol 3-O-methyltransferase UbiG [Xanthomonadaceae bacterium]|nr:bifunctional 2-polyprenyl-6-hydroxyphenol methylase/3-demethylubiquinol 3-O-methyltransferase UbiG [Xanthomonadaceae bacterium]
MTNSSARTANINPGEIEKFDALASRWWDPEGDFKPLHDINPLRLDYIESRVGPLRGRKVLDVGCGGGILSEGMAQRGAQVLGIDMAGAALEVASLHALETGVEVEYRQVTVESLAAERLGEFEVVTCLEMLEHVPDPASVIRACATLVEPGGHVIFSTLNRNPRAYLFAIVGAEYLLRLLPKGTHDYSQFIRPSELAAWARPQLELQDLRGLSYNPLTRRYSLSRDIGVNYLAHFRRVEAS